MEEKGRGGEERRAERPSYSAHRNAQRTRTRTLCLPFATAANTVRRCLDGNSCCGISLACTEIRRASWGRREKEKKREKKEIYLYISKLCFYCSTHSLSSSKLLLLHRCWYKLHCGVCLVQWAGWWERWELCTTTIPQKWCCMISILYGRNHAVLTTLASTGVRIRCPCAI